MSGVLGMKLKQPRKRPPPRFCSVAGREGVHAGLGFCGMHYERVRSGRPVGPAEPLHRPKGTGNISNGYVVVYMPGHPLVAGKSRPRVHMHRAVLYDAIGPGPHPCHWCGKSVTFRVRSGGPDWLVVDHLDHDGLNNDRSNLVPSCTRCNTMRHGRTFP